MPGLKMSSSGVFESWNMDSDRWCSWYESCIEFHILYLSLAGKSLISDGLSRASNQPLRQPLTMAPSSPPPGARPKKRVLVVGAGAAGMSCAEQLSQHPEKYDVTLVEAQDYCGGQAFSIPIDEEKHGAPWMNQGVQG